MKSHKIFLILLLTTISSLKTYPADVNILEAGAIPDGIKLNTEIIQSSINKVSESGGGSIVFPPGKYLTGSLVMKDGVTLDIRKGATLLGSKNLQDYLNIQPDFIALRTGQPTKQLLYAEGQTGISIIGNGTIDGQGGAFERAPENDEPGITRPHLIQFIKCKDIRIDGISLYSSGGWMQHYLACDNIQINGITIYNHSNYNNDGIDIDGCHNVLISNCIVDTDDDGICLKSTSPAYCKDVVITNCVVKSHCNALKMGTETTGGFQNIVISNCTVSPSADKDPIYGTREGQSAISVEMVDGGLLDQVNINNITVTETRCPIFIRLGNRARKYTPSAPQPGKGTLRNVMISNVMATTSFKTSSNITGIPDNHAENICLNNIFITNKSNGTEEDANIKVPEKIDSYPTAGMFGNVLPASGFFVRHVKNITFNNVQLFLKGNDARPAFIFHDVTDALITHPVVYSYKNDTTLIVKDRKSKNIKVVR